MLEPSAALKIVPDFAWMGLRSCGSSAIFEALNRLEAAGIVTRVRRLVRRVVDFGGRRGPDDAEPVLAPPAKHQVGVKIVPPGNDRHR